ncbi:MAG: hypothetical protein FWD35_04455 [Oscillospiraceae bacterium]|nr:hypothetical protein [Oscillospiraceae bacterium]
MSIRADKIKSTNPDEYPLFDKMNMSDVDGKKIDLLLPLETFSTALGVNWADVKYSDKRITEIVTLIQKRRVYFRIFHDVDMGELNEACLFCFWILKLYPFYNSKDPNHDVNLVFALALFTRAVNYVAKARKRTPPNFTQRTIDHLVHAFTYRDLSKEAIMAIAECLIG